jgi:hypothetical protein
VRHSPVEERLDYTHYINVGEVADKERGTLSKWLLLEKYGLNIRGLNFVAVKHTTVEVTRLLL